MKGAVLLVTHDRYVPTPSPRASSKLENAGSASSAATTGTTSSRRRCSSSKRGRVESNRQNLVRRELAWLRGARRRGFDEAEGAHPEAEAVIAVQAPREAGKVKLDSVAMRTGKTILELRDVGLDLWRAHAHEQAHAAPRQRGTASASSVRTGSEKTTLLRLVTGESHADARGGRARRADQDRLLRPGSPGLIDDWSIFDNVAEREGAERTGAVMVHLGDRTLDLRRTRPVPLRPRQAAPEGGPLSGASARASGWRRC